VQNRRWRYHAELPDGEQLRDIRGDVLHDDSVTSASMPWSMPERAERLREHVHEILLAQLDRQR
jgi:hypothetical protein